ncbi:Glycosyl hydrolases family 16 [Seminavis robusta]|uniref:Glycosyl hydrolases family 16 n=1 Tax=Seminavis robusta TaxID=568900 RepID=A0A9N8D6F0_9STRA|nr:Glycosyl hydrolases family 16 [Seminavis robusta]|eukprot:Sro1_g000440.1 Glycosyl hydrolases family 16 (567) ;mRNA; f:122170-123870
MSISITNKKVAAAGFCLMLAVLSHPVTAEERALLWSEEFNIGSQPRSETWSYDVGNGGWGNGELQTYTDSPANVRVENGFLKIIAQKDEYTNPPTFTSARIKTEGKMSFKYGTMEARVKSPDVDAGLWPAFWTLGANVDQVGWPKAGEVDIMELGQGIANAAGLGNKRVVSAAHWDYQGNYATYANYYDSPTNLSEAFHVYRLEWTPERMTTFVDDAKIWEMIIDESACADCEELHHPHFILFNMAVGGGFTSGSSSSSSSGGSSCAGSSSSSSGSHGGCGSDPDDITAPFPGEMVVDWVRLYDNGFTEVDILPTPQPTPILSPAPTSPAPTKAPISNPPTKGPVSNPPTKAPVSNAPASNPLTKAPATTVFTSAPTKSPTTMMPTSAPTLSDRLLNTPYPTTTSPRVPPTLSPPTSFDEGDDDDDDSYIDSIDCVSRSGSRSSGKGKGGKGKGGKAGGSSRRSSSGGKAGASRRVSSRSGKSGKGGKRVRRLSNSNGKGRSKGNSGSARSGCHSPGNSRVGASQQPKTTYVASHAAIASAAATPFSFSVVASLGIGVLLGCAFVL